MWTNASTRPAPSYVPTSMETTIVPVAADTCLWKMGNAKVIQTVLTLIVYVVDQASFSV